jgi:WD40 repeat protein
VDVRVSADGRSVVSGGADETIAVWDAALQPVHRIVQPHLPISSVDVSADGSVILGAGPEWAYAFQPDGTVLATFTVFPSYARLSVDGTHLLTLETVRVGYLEISNPIVGTVWPAGWDAMAFSPDGRFVAESGPDRVNIWEVSSGALARTIAVPATALAFSADGTMRAQLGYDGTVQLERFPDGELLRSFAGAAPVKIINSLAFSPDGAWLAASGTQTVATWRTADGSPGPVGISATAGRPPSVVAFSPDGGLLAVGDDDGAVFLWSFPEGAFVRSINVFPSAPPPAVPANIESIQFWPDGTRLLVSGQGGIAIFGTNGDSIAQLSPLWSGTPPAALSADGLLIAGAAPPELQPYATSPSLLALWSGTDGHLIRTFSAPGPESYFTAGQLLQFSPTSHALAYATLGSVRIFCLP